MRSEVLLPCGDEPASIAPTDQLAATWKAPEDGRMRELLLFESDAVAKKYADSVRQLFESCPGDEFGGGEATVVTVQEASNGFVGGITNTFQGTPTVGVAVVRVAQVDNRVLIATAASEGSDPCAAARQVERELSSVLALIRADEAGS